MDTQKLIARLRERAATQDACGCWSLDRAVADELERLSKIEMAARVVHNETSQYESACQADWRALDRALAGLS